MERTVILRIGALLADISRCKWKVGSTAIEGDERLAEDLQSVCDTIEQAKEELSEAARAYLVRWAERQEGQPLRG